MTAYKRLNEECKYLNLIFLNSYADKIMATCLCAKIYFAFECKLINEDEMLYLMDKARLLLQEEE